MKFFVFILILTFTVTAQDRARVIKASQNAINIEIDGRSMRWSVGQAGRPNIREVDIPNGKPRTVKYVTDTDSISFAVEAGKTYDFVIEKDGVSYSHQIVGLPVTPDKFKMKRFLNGSPQDAKPKLHGPVLNLDGADREIRGFQPTIDKVRGCTNCAAKLDVVVISTFAFDTSNPVRCSGSAGFYHDKVSKMKSVDSVEVLYFTDPADANTEATAKAIE